MKPEENDRLEQFVNNNKQEFDTAEPSEKVWKGISNSLQFDKERNSALWIWKAATVLLLITSGYLFYVNQTSSENTHQLTEANNKIDEEFSSTEAYYVSLIREKQGQVYDYLNAASEFEGVYEVDVEQLDAMYEVIKEEYEENPSKQLQEAMTLNLIVRINILNQQLSEIEGVKKKKESVGV